MMCRMRTSLRGSPGRSPILRQALAFVNQALLFDNSSADEPYRFVAEFRDGKRRSRKGYRPAWAARFFPHTR